MKKKLAIILFASLMFVSGVSAASLWGTYKGNEIVRVLFNGNVVRYKDVPAISLNGRVMIPVSMLKDVGVSYTWDQINKTIILTSSTGQTQTYYPPVTSTPQQPVINNNVSIKSSELKLYSNDGKTFLGTLSTNTYDLDSIFNKYGTYGSSYSLNSITNNYGTYGSDYSIESAYNKYATKPPILTYKGETIFYVTMNKNIKNSITPQQLYDFATSLE
ncbi:hypothetical protein GCM10008014_08810 [Paenibacillus silvae]|uniref:Copper amine oxidase-like N-terminal domain-containing protein n=1 Tax=Paenibacillus silvae TaxID=1325358 RepID=A0ABQ1Z3B4_9BACL|nr:hypothetical protein [Paenibacillus silvae]GGH46258.1 hypothetical protein GCM10008014_08810 [Paenibacillus silvae]